MVCPNCGCSNVDGARFCSSCGEKISILAPVAHSAMPAYTSPVSCDGIPVESAPASAAPPPVKQGTHWIPLVIMALLCVLGLSLFFALPYSSASEEPAAASQSETPWFVNEDGTLYFLEHLYDGSEELTVPDTVDGMPVTAIGDHCFSNCSSLTTVILPDGITTIGEEAFFGCTSMRGIFLPEGVTQIGENAFLRCSALEAICIPSTVEAIGEGAFDGCINLAYILYNGIHSHWKALYGDYITLETQVYCTDGTFVHRRATP